MLKGDYLRHIVEIEIQGVSTVLEVLFMYLVISVRTILLQCSVSLILFDPMKNQVDRWNVEGSIQLVRNIYLVADIIPPGVPLVPLLGWSPSLSNCFLVYLSLLHEFHPKGIGLGLGISAGLPK